MSSLIAQVTQGNARSPPQLTAGYCSVETLSEWETGVAKYKDERNIDDDKLADKVCLYIADKRTSDWIRSERVMIKSLTFPAFYQLLRPRLLGVNWDTKLFTELSAKTQGSLTFEHFTNEVRTLNAHLSGSHLHMDDTTLMITIKSRLHPDLLENINSLTAKGLFPVTADLWFAAAATLDEARFIAVKAAITAARTARGTWGGGVPASSSSAPARSAQNSRPPSSQSTQRPSSSQGAQPAKPARTMPRKLTDDERALLSAHQGCFGCRKFYAGHMAFDCPSRTTPPPADTPFLTAAMAATAKAKFDRNRPSTDNAPPIINAVLADGSPDYIGSCVLDDSEDEFSY